MKRLQTDDPKTLQLKYAVGELAGLRKVIEWLWDGNIEAFNALLWCKSNYKEWPDMIMYCKKQNLRGSKLVEVMRNASPDGGGYHMGWEYINSRMKGNKHNIIGIKDLL